MGLRGDAAIVGIAEWKPERRPTREPMFSFEQYAELAKEALDDAGIGPKEVNGLCTTGVRESSIVRAGHALRVHGAAGQLRRARRPRRGELGGHGLARGRGDRARPL